LAKTDICISGVGGQGSLTSSRILGEAATRVGLKVLVGEIHGMAQRGGIVESTVRIGEVYGPIVSDGDADVLIGFEPVEALRSIAKVSERTVVIVNTHCVVPANVSMAGAEYPKAEEVVARIAQTCKRVIAFDATAAAKLAGNAQAMGSVLLGALAGSGALPFEASVLEQTILDEVPARAKEVNRKAFAAGVAAAAGK
jgi:indolepyruvate ferredoxin oxidoreductase beta subunit